VAEIKGRLGIKSKGRVVTEQGGAFELKESIEPYISLLGHENEVLSHDNRYSWEVFDDISI
jgi:hypothetical protein